MGKYVKIISKSNIWGVDILILVALGTQDKKFTRLLKAIDHEIEIGNIKDKVIVQAGYSSDYQSDNMEIFDLISTDEFDKLLNQCDLLITHGGVGTIINGLKHNKIVIAVPRLKKYKEHVNDHQLQIVNNLSEAGYILKVDDLTKFAEVIADSKTFKPKKFKSNTDNMIKLVRSYIEK
jgi:UDP-N-acetylglucosamine transferase subunit ALG13